MDQLTSSSSAKDVINKTYSEHQDLLIFALTGRTGSGCTTAASLLASDFNHDLTLNSRAKSIEKRKHEIVAEFAEKRWLPFTKVTVSSLLIAFLATDLRRERDEDRQNRRLIRGEDRIHNLAKELTQEDVELIALLTDEDRKIETSSRAEDVCNLLSKKLPALTDSLKAALSRDYSAFMQTIGDNVRSSGNTLSDSGDPTQLFKLPRAIVRAIEFIRERDKAKMIPTRIVIDAIRNPLELVYLRDRYSPLYAIAITANEDDRKDRLHALGLDQATIDAIDAREYPEKHDPLSSYHNLITQDIQSCLQKADIFVGNTGKHSASEAKRQATTAHLYSQLVRYYAVALRPGLVTPTRDERCMQVALVAKLNSGCISRQVGAAVTDGNYVVRAIGWNDVPRGQVPCALRNVDALKSADDDVAYSEYERSEDKLRSHILETHSNRSALKSEGIPCSFCFKDAANGSVLKKNNMKGNNQVHTRSLHAEENAFLQLTSGGSGDIRGGRLYTTASPCELCSKKAYQLGIADIVYIDPYPGISVPQIIMSGDLASRPSLRLFNGAVGKAYHRLYEALLPIKDELTARLSA